MSQSRPHILYVDDEPHNLMMFKIMFRRVYDVTTATGGQEALNEIKGTEFDLMVTDFKMPGMNGLELTHLVREIRPSIPVIMVTGFMGMVDEEDIKSQDIELISKPFDEQTISGAIKEALSGNSF